MTILISPFDPRTVLLAKHAQHAVLIHFPIALFVVGTAFDFLARWTKQRQLAAVAYYNILTAAFAVVPTVFTGVLAWQFALEGQKLKGILLMHLSLGGTSAILIWSSAIVHWRARRAVETPLPNYLFLIEAAGVAALMVAGHLGGFLSGVNGG
jgi:uncharacterized membrane protein